MEGPQQDACRLSVGRGHVPNGHLGSYAVPRHPAVGPGSIWWSRGATAFG
jgi:hypothetical protein